ncbi:MAG: hypothetical protein WCY92_06985 [Novosphingobium sp.]
MREDEGAEQALALLRRPEDAGGNRLHLGWGSFRNLDIVAARQSRWALLMDINIHQFRVWDAVLSALRTAASAEEFIELAVAALPARPRLRQFLPDTGEWLRADRARDGSWLAEHAPERFRHVSRMAREGRIELARVDMRGGMDRECPFAALSGGMSEARAAGVVPDTLYVSNVAWMLAQSNGFFGEEQGPDSAWRGARSNLALLAPHFRHIVCAMSLAPHARPDDLQWETRVYEPAEFIRAERWERMAGDGPRPAARFPSP